MSRTLLVALDGATHVVLDRLMDEGVMPELARLTRAGSRGVLRSTAHPLTPPAFTTMTTGRSPGHHGVFDFIRSDDRGDAVYFTVYDSRDNRCETIWSIASRQDRKVSALNFVMTAPVTPVSGYVVPGFVQWKHLRRHTWPSSLYEKLRAYPWFDPKVLCWDLDHMREAIGAGAPVDRRQWVRDQIAREAQWFDITRHMLRNEPTDLFSIVFDGVDKIQHLCWDVLIPDVAIPRAPDHDVVLGLCHDYFRALDEMLGEMQQLAGADSRMFLVSDHGFTGSTFTIHVNQLLADLGLFAWKEGASSSADEDRESRRGIDWSRTVAYSPTRSSNGIFIRVADRPGKVGVPAAEVPAVRERIVAALRALAAPGGDAPAVTAVLAREEAFPGPAVGGAPDLTLVPHDHGFVSTAPSPSVVVRNPQPVGTHHPDGIFLAAGTGIRTGEHLRPLEMVDVTPTLLYSLGLPIPSNFEGRVSTTAFAESHLATHPVAVGGPAGEHDPDGSPVAEPSSEPAEVEQAVLERLRALGYVE